MFFRPRDRQARFYEEHVDYVHRCARAMTRDEEQAREVIQRVFTEVLDAWGRIADVRDTRAWLRQVTRNHCWRVWKERARSPVPLELDPELSRSAWSDAPGEPDVATTRRQMRDAFLRAAYERLTHEEREVIQMRYLDPEFDPASEDDRTLDEMARSLGVARITVRRRLDGARKKLREALAAEGFEFERAHDGDEA